jgi:N-acylneuraminate cytidylyltransferase
MKILCLIPARSGSKGLPDKNIKIMVNKPLLAWSIEQAKNTTYYKQGLMRIIVSTDSEKYKQVALKWGAEVPFLRPKKISEDLSTDYEFIKHALDWFLTEESYVPDIILQLRPTQPCRKTELIDKCIDIFLEERTNYNSLRTVIEINKTPYKMFKIENNILKPYLHEYKGLKEPFNNCRQIFPKNYLLNGCVDIFNRNIVDEGMISGKRIYPYIMDSNNVDIDNNNDWKEAEALISTICNNSISGVIIN